MVVEMKPTTATKRLRFRSRCTARTLVAHVAWAHGGFQFSLRCYSGHENERCERRIRPFIVVTKYNSYPPCEERAIRYQLHRKCLHLRNGCAICRSGIQKKPGR